MTPYILFFDQNLETPFAIDVLVFMVDKWELPSFSVMDLW
jgi:hypothetical protein